MNATATVRPGAHDGSRNWWHRVRAWPWHVVVVLVAYRLIARCYFKYMRLPEESYFEPVIFTECLKNPATAAILLLPTAFGLWHFQRLAWNQLEHGAGVRWLLSFSAAMLAYAFSTYDYNHYFDQYHMVDRVLLVIAAALVAWHPAFIGLFVGLAAAIASQFEHPLGSYPWTDKKILFGALVLFMVFLYSTLWRKRQCVEFIFLAICMQAANYFYPGAEKLRIGWLFEENLGDLSKSAHLNGWLSFVDNESYFRFVENLEWMSGPLIVATLVFELSALLVFWRRPLAYVVFGGCALMHVGIFLSAGILFWMWVLFDIALLVIMATLPAAWHEELFRRPSTVLWGALLIAASPAVFQPEKLAWHSTELNTFFQMEAVGQSGRVYQVSNSYLSPYDFTFCISRFWYLTRDKVVVGTIGSTVNAAVKNEICQAESIAEVDRIEEQWGLVHYDERRASEFDRFTRNYFQSVNASQGKRLAPEWAVPHHIWHFERGQPFRGQEPVQQIRVRMLKLRHRDCDLNVVEDRIVRLIDIPSGTTIASHATAVRR